MGERCDWNYHHTNWCDQVKTIYFHDSCWHLCRLHAYASGYNEQDVDEAERRQQDVPLPSDRTRVVAQEILGACRCHDAYTTRKMIDPGCAWHEYHLEFEEALTTFATAQVGEARRIEATGVSGLCHTNDSEGCHDCEYCHRRAGGQDG